MVSEDRSGDGIVTQRDLQEQMAQSLRHIEALLLVDQTSKPDGPSADPDEVAAQIIAGWIEKNTAKLSEIGLFPDAEPKNPEEEEHG